MFFHSILQMFVQYIWWWCLIAVLIVIVQTIWFKTVHDSYKQKISKCFYFCARWVSTTLREFPNWSSWWLFFFTFSSHNRLLLFLNWTHLKIYVSCPHFRIKNTYIRRQQQQEKYKQSFSKVNRLRSGKKSVCYVYALLAHTRLMWYEMCERVIS